MKKMVMMLTTALCAVSLIGCENMSKQDAGTITGGIAGGILGSTIGQGSGRVLAIAAGTVAGAVVGNAIGKNMDDTDRMKMNSALEDNAVGQPAYWKNQNSGTAYKVTPTKNVAYKGNRYCREYTSTAVINGRSQQVYGTACRQKDGSWQIVN